LAAFQDGTQIFNGLRLDGHQRRNGRRRFSVQSSRIVAGRGGSIFARPVFTAHFLDLVEKIKEKFSF
jgi:hypothetical protein